MLCQYPRSGSLWPLFEPFGDRAAPAVREIRNLVDPIIEDAMAKKLQLQATGAKMDADDMTFLDYMISKIDGELRSVPTGPCLFTPAADVELVRAEVLNILLASRDTVRLGRVGCLGLGSHGVTDGTCAPAQIASLLTFTVYCLTQHPDVQHALRAEVERVVGESREPTHADIREMRYREYGKPSPVSY